MYIRLQILLYVLSIFTLSYASLEFNSNSIKDCTNTSSTSTNQFKLKDFNVDLNPTTNKLSTSISAELTSEITSAKAVISLTVLGSQVLTVPLDICTSISGKSLCPLQPGSWSQSYSVDLPKAVTNIADILNKIPGSGITGKVSILDAQGNDMACVSVGLVGETKAKQPAIQASLISVAGLSTVLTTISAVSSAAMVASLPAGLTYQTRPGPTPSFMDVISTFQFMATSGMMNVNYPDFYQDFSTNFGWSTGVINIPAFQNAIDKLRPNTNKLVRRAGLDNLLPDRNATSYSQLAGIQAYATKLKVKPENYFLTVLMLFGCVLGGLTVLLLLLRGLLELLAKFKPKLFLDLRNHYANYYLGNLLRVQLLLYYVLATAACFQLTLNDLWQLKVVAGVVLGVFCVLLMGFVSYLVIREGPYRLYSEPKLNYRYGALYSDYRQPAYIFFIVVIICNLIRAFAVGVLADIVWAQLTLLVLCEIFFFIMLFFMKPYATKLGNTLMVFIGVLRVANTGLTFFYIESVKLPDLARTILAYAMLALQAIMVLAITIMTLWGLVITVYNLIKGNNNTNGDDRDLQGNRFVNRLSDGQGLEEPLFSQFKEQSGNNSNSDLQNYQPSSKPFLHSDILDAKEDSTPVQVPAFFKPKPKPTVDVENRIETTNRNVASNNNDEPEPNQPLLSNYKPVNPQPEPMTKIKSNYTDSTASSPKLKFAEEDHDMLNFTDVSLPSSPQVPTNNKDSNLPKFSSPLKQTDIIVPEKPRH